MQNNIFIITFVFLIIVLATIYFLTYCEPKQKKTRYFLDGQFLRRWKFGQKHTMAFGSIVGWVGSKKSLSQMLKNHQEISSLVAYQMFPNAFKK